MAYLALENLIVPSTNVYCEIKVTDHTDSDTDHTDTDIITDMPHNRNHDILAFVATIAN